MNSEFYLLCEFHSHSTHKVYRGLWEVAVHKALSTFVVVAVDPGIALVFGIEEVVDAEEQFNIFYGLGVKAITEVEVGDTVGLDGVLFVAAVVNVLAAHKLGGQRDVEVVHGSHNELVGGHNIG